MQIHTYITLHYITLHHITSHHITLHTYVYICIYIYDKHIIYILYIIIYIYIYIYYIISYIWCIYIYTIRIHVFIHIQCSPTTSNDFPQLDQAAASTTTSRSAPNGALQRERSTAAERWHCPRAPRQSRTGPESTRKVPMGSHGYPGM